MSRNQDSRFTYDPRYDEYHPIINEPTYKTNETQDKTMNKQKKMLIIII